MNDFKRDILKTLTNNPGVYYIKAMDMIMSVVPEI